mgnify:FL=1
MGLVRFSVDSEKPRYGVLDEGTVLDVSQSDICDDTHILDRIESVISIASTEPDEFDAYNSESVRFHQPVEPSKILRLEGCYENDLTDQGFDRFVETDGLNENEWPGAFAAPPTTIVPPDSDLELPQFAEQIRPGLEVGFVIGTDAKYLNPGDAMDAVSGILAVATLTVFDDLPGLFGYKSFDSALPVARQVVPRGEVPVEDLSLSLSVNGEELDRQSTASWRFEPGEFVASMANGISLRPGDVILTGNPMRVDRTLADGDRLSVSIDGVGTRTSKVVRESTDVGIRI